MSNIFIEGVCGTGKTTAIMNLAKELPALTIPELPEFNRGLLLPFNSKENIQYNFLKYIDHEYMREGVFSRTQSGDILIADRSYISIISLVLSMEDYLGKEFINILINLIIKKINTGEYIVPDKIIILSASYETIYHRNKQKTKILDDIWLEKSRILKQELFHKYLVDKNIATQTLTNDNIDIVVAKLLYECRNIRPALKKEELKNGLSQYL